MTDKYRVLLVSGNDEFAATARTALSGRPGAVVQRLNDPAIASARLGGGDIDLLLIDPGALGDHLREWSNTLPPVPTIVATGAWTAELARVATAHPSASGVPQSAESDPHRARWMAFLGAKGGVGTSTVSLNVASALAEHEDVLLAELNSGLDTLAFHVGVTGGPLPPAHSEGALFQRLRHTVDKPSVRVGLKEDIAGWEGPDDLRRRLEMTLHEAEVHSVVLDLGAAVAEPVRAILPRLDSLTIVLDWDALSMECGRRTLSSVAGPGGTPASRVRALVVNRSALASPPGLEEIGNAIGAPIQAAIPPAADLCCAATKARRPVIRFDPQSLIAETLVRAATSIAAAIDDERGKLRASRLHA